MDRALYQNMIISKVIPAIRSKFPGLDKNVVIQQDGAKSHITEYYNVEFLAVFTMGYSNITLETQNPSGLQTLIIWIFPSFARCNPNSGLEDLPTILMN
jgi:hypothetical protein